MVMSLPSTKIRVSHLAELRNANVLTTSVFLYHCIVYMKKGLHKTILFQRLSVSIQRFNAVLLHDCFVDEVAGHSSEFCSIM